MADERGIDLRGAKEIARELNVSERTVRRWAAAGTIKVWKGRGRNSPIRMTRQAVRRLRGE